MAAVIERNVINGMDVGALHETMEAIRDRPQLAQFHFRVHNRWFSGHHSRSVVDNFHGVGHETTTRDLPFQVEIDEPPELLGGNAAPDPVEYVLSALAGCLTSALVMSASAKGVRLDAVESSLEGDVDVRGLLGMDDQIRPGYQEIRVTFRITSDAPRETLEECVRLAQERSPVFDIVTNRVPVSVRLE